jgi:serine/threonine protein kinase
VADFGLSRTFAATTATGLGTVAWSAPELLAAAREGGSAADVYAYGVVLWELGSGLAPYADVPPIAVALGVLQRTLVLEPGLLLPDAPPVLVSLFPRCVAYEPADRPTFSQVVNEF